MLYPFMWDRLGEVHKRFDELYPFMWDRFINIDNNFNNIKKELLISRVLSYQIPSSFDHNLINQLNYSPLVSVIITVYNIGSKYLIHCLETVINQTLKDIEIIIVNDCSPLEEDDKICSYYKEKDSRIKYIKLDENVGSGASRMEGLKLAKGYSVSFIDGDDYLSLDLYNITFYEMIRNNLDIVCYNFFILQEKNGDIGFINSYYKDIPYSVFYDKDIINIFSNINTYISGHLWNKLFKRDILLKIGYNNIPARKKYEDLNYSFKIFLESKSISYIPVNLYFYIESRKNSFVNTTRFKDSYLTDMYDVLYDIYNYIGKSSNKETTNIFVSNLWLYYEACTFDNAKLEEEDHFINIYRKMILDSIKHGVLDKELLLENIKFISNDQKLIEWFIETCGMVNE